MKTTYWLFSLVLGLQVALGVDARVKTGLDVLSEQHFAPLDGKRIGLITAHTGISQDRRRNVDLLARAGGLKLVAIFAPEHGITGTRTESVEDSVDQATGISIYSLESHGAENRFLD